MAKMVPRADGETVVHVADRTMKGALVCRGVEMAHAVAEVYEGNYRAAAGLVHGASVAAMAGSGVAAALSLLLARRRP